LREGRAQTLQNQVNLEEQLSMGTWGTGAFENDGASDWAWELEKAVDLSLLQQALQPANGYLEAPEGELLVAASQVLAAALGGPAGELPEGVCQWLQQHPQLPFSQLLNQAHHGLLRVLGADSELAELWGESEEGAEWRRGVENLAAGLRPPS